MNSQSLFTNLFTRARKRLDQQPWSAYADATRKQAEHLLTASPAIIDQNRHVWQMEQERVHTKCILNLAGWYRITDDERFAKRSWQLMEELLSWDKWYTVDKCDLFTGETAATVAILLDWLGPWLSKDQRARLVAAAEERIFGGYLHMCPPDKAPEDRAWWYRVKTNWNSVCNGGVLTLALALRGDPGAPSAEKVIPLTTEGLQFYIDGLPDDGSCIEGIGYWQYGILYLFYACLAWEQAYGEQHPALQRPALREGLAFPFDFTPRSAPIAFCDGNRFPPYGILLAITARTGVTSIAAQVQERVTERFKKRKDVEFDPFWEYHPDEIYALLFAEKIDTAPPPLPEMRTYPNVGWSIFNVNDLSLSFRAGSSAVPHALIDLCSIGLSRNGEVLLGYVENWPYPTGWFNQYGSGGPVGRHMSRALFPENGTSTKNSLLVNGIGQFDCSPSEWGYDEKAQRSWCDATQAYPWFAKKISRTVERTGQGFRLTDEFETSPDGWHELRFHSRGTFRRIGNENAWIVENEGQQATMRFSCGHELFFVATEFVPSVGVRPKWNVLRVMPLKAVLSSKFVTEIS